MYVDLPNVLFLWAVRELDNPVEHRYQVPNSPALGATEVTSAITLSQHNMYMFMAI